MTDRTMEALKPCPFCGGEVDLYGFVGGSYDVVCRGCDATMGMSGPKADAIAAWNRRAALTPSPPGQEDGNRPLPLDRETLGRMVREAWVRWAQTQPSPKPSWLLPYDDLSEPDKEADRQIGETIARWTLIHDAARNSFCAVPPQEGGIAEVEGLIERLRNLVFMVKAADAACGSFDKDILDLVPKAAAELSRLWAMTATSIGVGNGSGQLFVHGDYDSIKAVQKIIFEWEDLRRARALSE